MFRTLHSNFQGTRRVSQAQVPMITTYHTAPCDSPELGWAGLGDTDQIVLTKVGC